MDIISAVREGTEQDVKVDPGKVPDVEWNCLCAVLLPAIREYYGLDKPEGGKEDGCSNGNRAIESA